METPPNFPRRTPFTWWLFSPIGFCKVLSTSIWFRDRLTRLIFSAWKRPILRCMFLISFPRLHHRETGETDR